uniref:Nuclear hormone receptor FTZ-F1 n=1 Tax=Dermatophagoides pteronyssinus TaxID=6956 RepID=A0A6P6XRX9_DERPT|nr:nuclear hormone receptor FTZ-F1-like isoform X2 [Dermatophagoides pteronyssinus]
MLLEKSTLANNSSDSSQIIKTISATNSSSFSSSSSSSPPTPSLSSTSTTATIATSFPSSTNVVGDNTSNNNQNRSPSIPISVSTKTSNSLLPSSTIITSTQSTSSVSLNSSITTTTTTTASSIIVNNNTDTIVSFTQPIISATDNTVLSAKTSTTINNNNKITTTQNSMILPHSTPNILLNIKSEQESPPANLKNTKNNTAICLDQSHHNHQQTQLQHQTHQQQQLNPNSEPLTENNTDPNLPPPPPSSSSSTASQSPTNNLNNNLNSTANTVSGNMLASSGSLTANTPNNNHMMDYHTQQQPPPPSSSSSSLTSGHHHHHQPQHHQSQMSGGQHPNLALTPQQQQQTMLPLMNNNNQQPTISVAAVVTAASSSPNSDPKDCIEELCPVCGDRVSGYHYGLLTCESCKGFFKRTVQNKKVYTCVADRNCHIDKSQRKRCPYCRFQKCLDVGMKLEAVRADRMRGGRNKFGPMYKRDRARRLQILRQKQLSKAHHVVGVGNGGSLGPPGATILPGSAAAAAAAAAANEALNFLNTAPGSHAGSIFDGVKPELIQIPQLSSSTSSPDSSPSPGSTAGVAAAAAAAAAGQLPNVVAAAAAAGHPHFMSPLVPSTLQQQSSNLAGANLSQSMMSGGDQHILKWGPNGPGPSNNNGNNTGPSGKSGLQQQQQQQHYETKLVLPQLMRELQLSMLDDKEWQSQLYSLLQNQTYNQCEVDLFELMCKVIDQSLFAQVDWARNSIFFKDLKVDDQMKLLQNAWSDMLVLDHIHQRIHAGLPDETTLPNGQKFDLLSLALLGVPQVVDQLHRVTARLQELKFDTNDYICLKFLLLLNPVRGLTNFKLVHDAYEQTKQALLDYCLNFYPQITDKFNLLFALVPEIHALTLRGEDFLYYKHMNGSAPTQTLLMEMLHAKKK